MLNAIITISSKILCLFHDMLFKGIKVSIVGHDSNLIIRLPFYFKEKSIRMR